MLRVGRAGTLKLTCFRREGESVLLLQRDSEGILSYEKDGDQPEIEGPSFRALSHSYEEDRKYLI